MIINTDYFVFLFALLLLTGVVATKFSNYLGVPALVLFIGVGMLVGSDGLGLIDFANASLAQLFGILALIIILFEGGMQTDWKRIRPVLYPSLSLATVGVLLTAGVVAVAAKYILGVGWLEALLFGAIVGSTDAAAVFAVLKGQSIRSKLSSTLEAESGTNDPMAMFLTLALIELLLRDTSSYWLMIPSFIWQMGAALVIGYTMGQVAVAIMNRINLDSGGLYPILALGFAVLVYSSTALINASGLLAVYILALVIGNSDVPYRHSVFRFNEGFAWMMQILMFIVLGLLVFPSQLIGDVIIKGLILSAILILLARPISVFISLLFFKFSIKEKVFLSWSGLRGAVPIVLATYPMLAGLENSQMFFNVVFFVVLTSTLIQGLTMSPLAEKLGLTGDKAPVSPHSLELVSIGQANADIIEYFLSEDDAAVGKQVIELCLPDSVLIVGLIRDGELIAPRGQTEMMANDIIYVLTPKEHSKNLKIWFKLGRCSS
ncbi:potassium/proton antiporter [Heliorestis acidaminivorans]|uniref:Potassium/proton antiporter n=1 Tax=Heliorestis acidaminivorans TaxID=553427 RepID=A0A6I0EXY3_9FIRM|nr:potassium/proton antiporter [Heliorestis acidaminivorans]KAB2951516.1 potassium/proton antiporter [Heliorestis acidaminivorans]